MERHPTSAEPTSGSAFTADWRVPLPGLKIPTRYACGMTIVALSAPDDPRHPRSFRVGRVSWLQSPRRHQAGALPSRSARSFGDFGIAVLWASVAKKAGREHRRARPAASTDVRPSARRMLDVFAGKS